MRKHEVFTSELFSHSNGKLIPEVIYAQRDGVRRLYKQLLKEGRDTTHLCSTLIGIPVFKEEREGGGYELLYITEEGLVLYALMQPEDETLSHLNEIPLYEAYVNRLIDRVNISSRNMLPSLTCMKGEMYDNR